MVRQREEVQPCSRDTEPWDDDQWAAARLLSQPSLQHRPKKMLLTDAAVTPRWQNSSKFLHLDLFHRMSASWFCIPWQNQTKIDSITVCRIPICNNTNNCFETSWFWRRKLFLLSFGVNAEKQYCTRRSQTILPMECKNIYHQKPYASICWLKLIKK